MRCNWSTTANILSRRAIPNHRPSLSLKNWLEPRATFYTPSRIHILSTLSVCYAFHESQTNTKSFMATRTYGTPPNLEPAETTPKEPSTAVIMTVTQLSRAASQAVRLCISNGELNNAYYIINSLRYSLLDDSCRLEKMGRLRISIKKFDPIKFGRPVSPRLAAHTLLHGLIRLGLTVKAYNLVALMMKEGIKLRTATLEAAFHALLPQTSSGVSDGVRYRLGQASRYRLGHGRSNDGSEVLRLYPSMISDQPTRYALRLLMMARSHRQRRTQDMYQSLIHACLLQGEIIVGSLLFVMVVKDWQLRRALAVRLNGQAEEFEVSPQPSRRSDADLRRLHHLRSESVFPSKTAMGHILASIEATMSGNPQDDSERKHLQAALQALANLAVLLDNRQIPFREIAPLLRALYRCPRVQNEVWILRQKTAIRVKAYSYFHSVLRRLIGSLPSRPPDLRGVDMLPPLHISAYNSLLHYALRHRLSPALANTVLSHMTMKENSSSGPDIVTFNILIRSGTLLRRSDISERALEMLRRIKENVLHGIMVEPSPKKTLDAPFFRTYSNIEPLHDIYAPSSVIPYTTSRFSKALSCLEIEHLDMLDTALPSPRSLFADSFTLTAYVTHLTSTGHPHIVADILFHVLPELAIVDHPSWGSMTHEKRQRLRIRSRQACLARAVTYGPHFFTVVLNALSKAGKTGLAERVWLLAKEAERVSWIPDFIPNSKPWCLPVHAYTIMIQCYGAEARKGLGMRRVTDRRFDQLRSDLSWQPRSKREVRGWATYILARNRVARQNLNRRDAGQKMGLLLFRSMISGARAIYDTLMSMNRQRTFGHVQAPAPDGRFFTAALDLFARQPHMYSRGMRTGRAPWRRRLRRANMRYARQGIISKLWTPFLQEIAEKMVDAGYSLPTAFRYIFVGRWTPGTLQLDDRRELERRPFTFPTIQSGTFRPHSAFGLKSRGLPVGRRRQPLRLGHTQTRLNCSSNIE